MERGTGVLKLPDPEGALFFGRLGIPGATSACPPPPGWSCPRDKDGYFQNLHGYCAHHAHWGKEGVWALNTSIVVGGGGTGVVRDYAARATMKTLLGPNLNALRVSEP